MVHFFKNSNINPELRFLPKNEGKNLKKITFLGLVVSFLSTTFSQAEDMGFFLSVSGLVSKGYRLYAETFEIKDPLFIYSNAIAIKGWGLIGPFILDFLITAAILPVSYLIGIKLTKSPYSSFLAAFLFQLTATGEFGNTLRSQIMGILFILLSIYFGLIQKWKWAGLFASAVLFSKMPLFVIVSFTLLALIIYDRRIKSALQAMLGFTIFSFLIFAILVVRGEFEAYINMVKENFSYASNYQLIVGQSEGFFGHFQIWNGTESRFVTFIISNLLIIVLTLRSKKYFSQIFLFVIFTNIGVAFFLLNTAMWPHHLQIISLYIFTNSLFIISTINSSKNLTKVNLKNLKQDENLSKVDLTRFIISIFVVAMLISNSGARLGIKPEMPLKNWLNPVWSTPNEIKMLQSAKQMAPDKDSFARLGMNDDEGFGAFLDPEWKFVCKRTAIIGSEPLSGSDSFLKCLDEVPDWILIAPFYESQSSRAGNYQYFFSSSQKILNEKFICIDFSAGYKYCIRKQ
jgi:hypothetical protein